MAQIEEGLVVRFIGDDSDLAKASKAAAQSLSGVDKAASLTASSLAKSAAVSTKLAQVSQQLARNSAQTGGALASAAKSSGSATQSLVDLSRITSDLPFGFLAISNNLDPMLQSFQRLQKETGSTKAALSAMVGSLSGPAGIGLALSAVSSLLILFGDDLFGSKKATEAQDTALDALNATLETSKSRFESLGDAIKQLDRLGSINLQIAGLPKVLDLQGQKVNKDIEIEAAQKREQELYDIYTKSLSQDQKLQDAALKALTDHQYKVKDLYNERTVLERQIALQRKVDNDERVENEREAAKKIEAVQKAANDKLKKAMEERKIFMQQMLTGPVEGGGIDPIKNFLKQQDAAAARQKIFTQLSGTPPNFKAIIDAGQAAAANAKLKETEERLMKISAAVSDYITPAFSSMFAAIANNEAPLQAFFKSIGQSLQQLMSQLLATAVQAAILSVISGGSTSFGAAFSKLAGGKIPGFAQGGLVFGPTLSLIGEGAGTTRRNPEIIAPLDKLKSFIGDGGGPIILETRISGDDLYLIHARSERKYRRVT